MFKFLCNPDIGLAFKFLCPPVDVLRKRKNNFHADILLPAGKGHGCVMWLNKFVQCVRLISVIVFSPAISPHQKFDKGLRKAKVH